MDGKGITRHSFNVKENQIVVSPLHLDDVTLFDDPALDERANRLTADTSIKLSNVYVYFRGLFQVRVYLGNEQICLACGSVQKCIRFADCALLYFWPYRKKPDRHIVETDLNLGLSHAERELKNTAIVLNYLRDVESILIGRRTIDPSQKRKQRARATRGEMFHAWGEMKTVLESIRLTAVEKSLGAYESAITAHIESGENLVKSIDRQIFSA